MLTMIGMWLMMNKDYLELTVYIMDKEVTVACDIENKITPKQFSDLSCAINFAIQSILPMDKEPLPESNF